jgi:nitrogen fixation-related uncharacterized protein
MRTSTALKILAVVSLAAEATALAAVLWRR